MNLPVEESRPKRWRIYADRNAWLSGVIAGYGETIADAKAEALALGATHISRVDGDCTYYLTGSGKARRWNRA